MDRPLESSRQRRDYSSTRSGGDNHAAVEGGTGTGRGVGGIGSGFYRGGRVTGGGGGGYNRGRGFGGRGNYHHQPYARGGAGGRTGGGGGGRGGSGGRGYHTNNQHNSASYRPYSNANNNSSGRSGGGGRNMATTSNSFGHHQHHHDPKQAAWRGLLPLLDQVGKLQDPLPEQGEGIPTTSSSSSQRSVVMMQSKNVQQLTQVVCGRQANIFLSYHDKDDLARTTMIKKSAAATSHQQQHDQQEENQDAISTNLGIQSISLSSTDMATTVLRADQVAGPLAAALVHCQAVWTLQTPTYAALTLSVHEYSQQQPRPSSSTTTLLNGFGQRVVIYCVQWLGHDLDELLLEPSTSTDQVQARKGSNTTTPPHPQLRHHVFTRLKCTLRYLTLLARLGLIEMMSRTATTTKSAAAAATSQEVNGNQNDLSLTGLLQTIVMAAVQASSHSSNNSSSNRPVAVALASLVLSTIPYLLDGSDPLLDENASHAKTVSIGWIQDNLLAPLQEHVLDAYQSSFQPGVGSRAILLHRSRKEESSGDIIDDEEEEDDDDGDAATSSSSGPICDTLQDLVRSVQQYLNKKELGKGFDVTTSLLTSPTGDFALFQDAPWYGLVAPMDSSRHPSSFNVDNNIEQMDGNIDNNNNAGSDGLEQGPETPLEKQLVYTGTPMLLPLFSHCQSLQLLRGDQVSSQLARVHLDGLVYGRLPIFGPPAGEGGEDDEDDMEGDTSTTINERLQSYRNSFGLVDRFFFAEAIRDCLISLESTLTESGFERGNAKVVAEHIWSIRHLRQSGNSAGVEYCIVEVMLSLITQSIWSLPFNTLYLSRVLLELTRLEPAIMSPAIVHGVAVLFEDYIPALVPSALHCLSRWFAFHLMNTAFQWPAAYWKHWEPFVLQGWSNSRGAFIKEVLTIMFENLSDPQTLLTDCLPKGSAIASHVLAAVPVASSNWKSEVVESLEKEVISQVWDHHRDADLILATLASDETSDSLLGAIGSNSIAIDRCWMRTQLLLQVLLSPARREHIFWEQEMARVVVAETESMDEDILFDDDVLSMMLEAFARYKSTFLGILMKDAAVLEEERSRGQIARMDGPASEIGEMVILDQLLESACYSLACLEACLHAFRAHRFVSVPSTLKWLLAQHREGGKPVLGWWRLASTTIERGLADQLSEMSCGFDMSDATEAVVDKKASFILDYLDPLLSSLIQWIRDMLGRTSTDSRQMPTAEHVELMEGYKFVVVCCHQMFVDSMHESISSQSINERIAESAIAGPALASLLDVGGNESVNVLRKALERM